MTDFLATIGWFAYPASLIASIVAAWFGRWGVFAAAYAIGWLFVGLAYFFLYAVPHGSHGSGTDMLALGLTFMAPLMVVASFVTGAIAFLLAMRL